MMWICPRCKRRNRGAVCDCGYSYDQFDKDKTFKELFERNKELFNKYGG
jgi:hypothetical protein